MPKSQLHLLSVAQIERIKPAARDKMHSDGGGLYLFNRNYGRKEWVFRYTSPLTKKRRKQSLGRYPDISVKEARQRATNNRILLTSGIDPIIKFEEDLLLAVQKHTEREENKLQTFEAVFENWKKDELKNRKDKGKETERMFKKDAFPLIGNKPISKVTKGDCKAVLTRLLDRKANRAANIMLSDFKQFFNYAYDEDLITQSPINRLYKDRVGGIQQPRKRVLSKPELVLLKDLMPSSGLLIQYRHVVQLYLATGCRRSELEQINIKKQINFANKTMIIPSEKSKNTDEHVIYLSDFAIQQIKAISDITEHDTWLFPNILGNGPITKGTITKQLTERQPPPPEAKPVKNRVNNNSLELSGGHWITHDLRRTAATIMQELGIMPYIIKKCLNQRLDDKIMETYQHAKMINEQKEAFEKLGSYLSGIFG